MTTMHQFGSHPKQHMILHRWWSWSVKETEQAKATQCCPTRRTTWLMSFVILNHNYPSEPGLSSPRCMRPERTRCNLAPRSIRLTPHSNLYLKLEHVPQQGHLEYKSCSIVSKFSDCLHIQDMRAAG